MVNEENIGHREALTLLIIMMTGKIFLAFPRNMALLGDAAGWIIILLAGIYSLVAWYFLNSVLQKNPERNLIEISRRTTGPICGMILNMLIFLFFLIITAVYLRQFAESFILAVLPETPISVITIIFMVLLIYGGMLGIEVISRVAWLFGPYLLAALAVILAFALPQINFEFLTPVLGPGPLPILKYSLFEISSFSEILLLGIIAPLIRKRDKVRGVGLYSLIIAIIINTAITAIVVILFNYAAAKKLVFPILQLTRLITFGEFIQRVEALFVFLWFFWAGIQVGGLFYGAVTSFAQTFKVKDYRPLLFPMAILVFTLSLIPTSMTQAVDWSGSTYANPILGYSYTMVAFGIPFLLWIISLFQKKRGDSR